MNSRNVKHIHAQLLEDPIVAKHYKAQSRRHSLQETIFNTAIGMLISIFMTQYFGVMVLGMSVNAHQNLIFTVVMTLVSILRGYLVRRYYNSH